MGPEAQASGEFALAYARPAPESRISARACVFNLPDIPSEGELALPRGLQTASLSLEPPMFALADNNPTRHIRFPFVNWALIAVCTLVFVAQVPWQDYAFTPAYLHLVGNTKAPGGSTEVLLEMVSYIFLHASWLHLLGNMLALWVFGDNIEDSMGHWRYPLFFVLCGMAGAGAEALLSSQPQVPVIGASGAISGLMGAYLMLHPRARVLVLVAFKVPMLVPAGVFVGLTVAFDVIAATAAPQEGVSIAFWAHVGGFAAGAVLILLMRSRDVPLFQPLMPYPEGGFLGLGRWLPDFGSARPGTSALWFWVKAVLFFLLVASLVEFALA